MFSSNGVIKDAKGLPVAGVTVNAAGIAVTLTATPDPGAPWVGWGGACSGIAVTCTVTMNSDLSLTANFR